MNNKSTGTPVSVAAFLAAILFTILIILFNTIPEKGLVVSVVAVLFHVVLFPVVAFLPSTGWARSAGYGWLVLDIAANIMFINGIDEPTCTALRYGAHIPAAIWIIITSLHCTRWMQVTGIIQAIIMGSYSFIAPWAPSWILYPAMILLIIWLLLAGSFLRRQRFI